MNGPKFTDRMFILTGEDTSHLDAYIKKVLRLPLKNGLYGANARLTFTSKVTPYPNEQDHIKIVESGKVKTVTQQFLAVDNEGKGVIFVYYEKHECGNLVQGLLVRKLPRLEKNELQLFFKQKEEELVPVLE